MRFTAEYKSLLLRHKPGEDIGLLFNLRNDEITGALMK